MKNRTRYSFSLSETLADQLHLFCQAYNCTPSDAMKQALDYYFSERSVRSRKKSILEQDS